MDIPLQPYYAVQGDFGSPSHVDVPDQYPDDYDELEKLSAEEFEKSARHRRSRAAAASSMVQAISSLKRGWLWEKRINIGGDYDVFARCGWTAKRLDSGESEVKLDDYEVLLSEEFVNERLPAGDNYAQ
jgi:hypothetical protein